LGEGGKIMPQPHENPKAQIPPELSRLEETLNAKFVRGKPYGDAVASVGPHEPHTIEINDSDKFAQGPKQVKAHEMTHIWRNQLPGPLIKNALPDDPKNPYDLSKLDEWRKQGRTLATIPQEAAAFAIQKWTADPSSRKQLQPWVNDLNIIPLSVEEPTSPNDKGINMKIRPPIPPASEARFMANKLILPKNTGNPWDRPQESTGTGNPWDRPAELVNYEGKEGEGTYPMWDNAGHKIDVNYSSVPEFREQGYQFDINKLPSGRTPQEQFTKDWDADKTHPADNDNSSDVSKLGDEWGAYLKGLPQPHLGDKPTLNLDNLTKIDPHQLPTSADSASRPAALDYVGREALRGAGNAGGAGLGMIAHPLDTLKGAGKFGLDIAKAVAPFGNDPTNFNEDMKGMYQHPFETLESMIPQAAIMGGAPELGDLLKDTAGMASYASEPLKNFGANRMDNLASTRLQKNPNSRGNAINNWGRVYLDEGGTPALTTKGLSDKAFNLSENSIDPKVAKRLDKFGKNLYNKSNEPWNKSIGVNGLLTPSRIVEGLVSATGIGMHNPIMTGAPIVADALMNSTLARSGLGYGAYQLGDLLGKANGLRPVMDTAPKFPSLSNFLKDDSGLFGFGKDKTPPSTPNYSFPSIGDIPPYKETMPPMPLGSENLGPSSLPPKESNSYPLIPSRQFPESQGNGYPLNTNSKFPGRESDNYSIQKPLTPPEKPFNIKDFLKNEEGSIKNPFEGLFGKKPLSNLTDTGPVDTNAMDQHTGFGQGGGTPLNLSGKVLPFDTGGDIESLLGGAKESSPNEMQWFHSGKEGPIPINSLKGNFKAGDPDKAFKLYDTPPPPLQFPKLNVEGYGPSNPRPMPTDFADKPNVLQNQIVATHPRQNFEPTVVQPDQFTSGFPKEGTAGSEIPHMNDIFDRLNTLRQNESKAYQNSLVKPGRQSIEPTNFKEMLMKLLKDDSGFTKFPEATPTSNKLVRGVEIPNNLGVNVGGTMENLGLNGYRVLPPQKVVPKQIPDVLGGEDLGKGGYNIIKNENKKSTTIPSPIEQQILNALKPSGGRIDLPDDGTPYSNYKIKK
jgi:hypothetical protein